MAFVLFLTVCNNDTTPSNNDKKSEIPSEIPIETVDTLEANLSSKSPNTKNTPYTVRMGIKNGNEFITLISTLNNNPDKYVYLDLSGSTITTIPNGAFLGSAPCRTLTGIILPDSVTSIEDLAFFSCTNLISVTFKKANTVIDTDSFFGCGSLQAAYVAGGVGTYTTTAPVDNSSTWTKTVTPQ
jgi:hypothetical protein